MEVRQQVKLVKTDGKTVIKPKEPQIAPKPNTKQMKCIKTLDGTVMYGLIPRKC